MRLGPMRLKTVPPWRRDLPIPARQKSAPPAFTALRLLPTAQKQLDLRRPTRRLPERNAQSAQHPARHDRHAGCGAPKPQVVCGPRSARSKSPPICRWVASAMTSVSGAASACSRAARFGVSYDPRSCATPSPIRSPTTASPVATPSRTRKSSFAGNLPTASMTASPARTARSASSSCARG